MPPKKPTRIGRQTSAAKRMKLSRRATSNDEVEAPPISAVPSTSGLPSTSELPSASGLPASSISNDEREEDVSVMDLCKAFDAMHIGENLSDGGEQNVNENMSSTTNIINERRNAVLLARRQQRQRRQQQQQRCDLYMAGFNYDLQRNYQTHSLIIIGNMDILCNHCEAKKFRGEPSGMCCSNGKVKLPTLDEPPAPLQAYMRGDNAESKHFLTNIRRYNSCFQMTSFGAGSIVQEPGFMPTFKIQGQVYHRAGSVLPLPNANAKYLQIYFMGDERSQLDRRCNLMPDTRREIVSSLQTMLHSHNHLVRLFRTALERMPTDEYKVIIKADKRYAGEHERRFNIPTVNEVAIVIAGDTFERRDIVLQKRSDTLQRISETHRSYDALQYPLIFWQGEDGYHFQIMRVNPRTGAATRTKVSVMDFYAYRLMVRGDELRSNHLLKCRHLFHQFVVDMYAKVESERLAYIRANQQKLRVDDYIHLRDAVANDRNITDVGRMVILPSTFIGSPRHMQQYAQDGMAYTREHGIADLFITCTCNPNWPEIKDNLFVGQSSTDRHDIIARVFNLKVKKLLDILTKTHVFGETRCWMYAIEWQKRDLPHVHILIWLTDKLRPADIDKVISAELPNPAEDPVLFDIISKNMIHGPCGLLNPHSPCMHDRKCSKRYPRQFVQDTQTGNDGYPTYRRRSPEDGGFTAETRVRINDQYTTVTIDNRWVVPYSPLLSKMFNAHINVEYCNSVKSIKYICSYINKGCDMAVFEVTRDTTDEVTQYQSGRYISSNEAVWRLLGFQIHQHHPTVVHLTVHLENGQRVYFTDETAHSRAENPVNTTLTAFFSLCQQDEFARTLLYAEVPKYYTFNKRNKTFSRRKQGAPVEGQPNIRASDAIGRVYAVHPSNAECFYLRMLLHHVRGPMSFDALKTIEGTLYETYREACQRLGLLENDNQWDKALAEAATTQFPRQMRDLFAIILTTCVPANPTALWEKHKESLSEDVLREMRRIHTTANYSNEIFNEALIRLENKCIAIAGKTLPQLGLNPPVRQVYDEESTVIIRDLLRETSYDTDQLTAFVTQNVPRLVTDQRMAFEFVLDKVASSSGEIIFLDAPGGTGKTYLLNLLLAQVRQANGIALAVASSGIAATLLSGGRTAHSAFKLPLDLHLNEIPICNINRSSGSAELLKRCKLIVWDECTMAHKRALEALDRTLRDIRRNDRIMGGTTVLLAGDFRQTLPIIPRSTPADEINSCLKYSVLWQHVQILTLQTNMRVHLSGDTHAQLFAQQLLRLGNGEISEDPRTGTITFPPNFCTIVASVEELIDRVFPNVRTHYVNHEWLCERAILAPRNDSVQRINEVIQEKLQASTIAYRSLDTVVDENEAVFYPTEFLNSLKPPGMPLHILHLKIGSPIILLRNLDPPKLCNGTRLTIKQLFSYVIEATILTGTARGENVFIPRIPLVTSTTDSPIEFKRLQFPIALAFAMTINKAQGQSLKVTGVNLETSCFAHGQLYVACSRVGKPSQLWIYAPEGRTQNTVYRQVLQ